MFLEQLSDKPSSKITKFLLIFGIVLLVIIYPLMIYFFTISNYPIDFFTNQLSFNGEIIKLSHIGTNIELYRVGQILDYGFMLSYGTIFFTLSLLIARKFEKKEKWMQISFTVAIFGIFAAVCDGIENVFILAMLTDPF